MDGFEHKAAGPEELESDENDKSRIRGLMENDIAGRSGSLSTYMMRSYLLQVL